MARKVSKKVERSNIKIIKRLVDIVDEMLEEYAVHIDNAYELGQAKASAHNAQSLIREYLNRTE